MSLYRRFIEAYVEAHPLLTKQKAYSDGQCQWNTIKGDNAKVEQEIARLNASATMNKAKGTLFFASAALKPRPPCHNPKPKSPERKQTEPPLTYTTPTTNIEPTKASTPSQDKLKLELNAINSAIAEVAGSVAVDREKRLTTLLAEKSPFNKKYVF